MYKPSVIIVFISFLYLVIVLFTLATDKTRFFEQSLKYFFFHKNSNCIPRL